MKDRDKYLLIGGAALVGAVLYMRSKQAAPTAAVAVPPPALGPVLKGSFTDALRNFFGGIIGKVTTQPIGTFPVPADLDAKTKARGAVHNLAWTTAWAKKAPVYSVGLQCYSTTSAEPIDTSVKGCAASMLES